MSAPSPVAIALIDERGFLRSLADIEADAIRHALEIRQGDLKAAAIGLGIGRSTLYRRMRALGLEIERFARIISIAKGPPRRKLDGVIAPKGLPWIKGRQNKRGRKRMTSAASSMAAARDWLARQGTGRPISMTEAGRPYGVTRNAVSGAIRRLRETQVRSTP